MKRKWLAVGIILLFVGTGIIPAIAQETEKSLQTSRGTWLYVGGSGPGNYTRIQDAIDNASDGDTVFVYDDSSPYYESLIINRSIILVGEAQNSTILLGNSDWRQLIHIIAQHVVIQGFTLMNNFRLGINIRSDNVTITDTIIKDMGRATKGTAVYVENANHINISDNVFTNVWAGVDFYYYPPSPNWGHNMICDNVIRYTTLFGIDIGGRYNIISGNDIAPADTTVDGEEWGIYIYDGGFNNISFNTVSSLTIGILVVNSYKNILYRNTLINNQEYGIILSDTNGDIVRENNFLENERNARFIYALLASLYIHQQFNLPLMPIPSIWEANYWGEPRSSPYPIPGHLMFGLFIPVQLDFFFNWFLHKSYALDVINFVRFDRHPSQQPYEI